MNKKITSIVLALCMVISCVAVGSFATSAASTPTDTVSAPAESESTGYTLADSIQNGQILQCWNWSYNGIKNNMKKIAEQGFTAIQTSPIQVIKESTQGKTMKGSWWVYYQPSNFFIDNSGQSAMGNKADFIAMCETAHQYGVKVVVDAVLNHMANNGDNTLSPTIPDDIRNDSNCWHSITVNTSNWRSRYDITHNCMGGLPDLNTGNSKIQNYEIAFMKECIDCGVDGFRFDGAKHIEVPNDNENAGSNFWTNLLNTTTSYAQSTKGITPYYYGEILDNTGGGQHIINQYTNLMSVTMNGVSNDIRNCVNSGNAGGAARSDFTYSYSYDENEGTAPAAKSVLWNESHDTYADGKSSGQSDTTLKKTWALVGSRAQAQAMYLARPSNYNSSLIGASDVTAWGDPEVAAVNHFKNSFVGQTEYLSSSGSIAYNERGTTGVVLVNCSGGSTSVSVAAHKMAAGTYKDEITGNNFTVSGGQISGQIGSTGVAVVYNAETGPSVSANPGSKSYDTDTLSIKLSYSDATSAQYSLDGGSYTNFTNGQTITIGQGLPYNTTTTLTLKATDGTKTKEATYTYTKVDPSAVTTIYFDNSSYNWSNPYAYVYDESGATVINNAIWPGEAMTLDTSLNLYKYVVPNNLKNGLVIFNDYGNPQYPSGENVPGLPINGTNMVLRGTSWTAYTDGPTQPTTAPPVSNVLIGDADQNNKVTIKDATYVQMHLASLYTLTGDALIAADCNKDNDVTVLDVTCIQRYLAHFSDAGSYVGTYTGGTQPVTQPTQATQPTQQTQPTQATQPPSGVVTLNASALANDDAGAPADYWMWTWNNDNDGTWVKGSGSGSSISFSTAKSYCLFVRVPQGTSTPDWDNLWGKTEDQTVSTGGTFTISGYRTNTNIMEGSWSGGGNTPSGNQVFLNAGALSSADAGAPADYWMWTWNNDNDGTWVKGSGSGSSISFSGAKSNCLFVRVSQGTNTPDWDNLWGKTDNQVVQTGGTFTISGYKTNTNIMEGSWSGGGSNPGGNYVILSIPQQYDVDGAYWRIWSWDDGGAEGQWFDTSSTDIGSMRYDGVGNRMIICRMNPEGGYSWDAVWNQTDTIVTQYGKTYTMTGWFTFS